MASSSIVFVTLLLNLCAGPQPVEVAVSGPVARVVLLLDDREVAVMTGPPWRTEVDFGRELAPHQLTAVGFDADGARVAEATRPVNLPAARAECALVADVAESEVPVGVEVRCTSYLGEQPVSLEAMLDDTPLAVTEIDHVELPPMAPGSFHLLKVSAHFASGLTASGQIGLGGGYGGRTGSELTAVPVVLESRRAPSPKDLTGWFEVNGESPRVVAVDRGPAQLYVVEDRSARTALIDRRWFGAGPKSHQSLDRTATQSYYDALRSATRAHRSSATIRFVDPFFVGRDGDRSELELVPVSRPFTLTEDILAELIYNIGGATDDGVQLRFSEVDLGHGVSLYAGTAQRLEDALAVAARHAAASQVPRAVLLLVGDHPQDASAVGAESVLAYLRSLQVPLVIWTTGDSEATRTPWGDAARIDTKPRREAECRRLVRALELQRIAWLDGSYPSGAIRVRGRRSDVRLATATP